MRERMRIFRRLGGGITTTLIGYEYDIIQGAQKVLAPKLKFVEMFKIAQFIAGVNTCAF
jgi:hypothetical protein